MVLAVAVVVHLEVAVGVPEVAAQHFQLSHQAFQRLVAQKLALEQRLVDLVEQDLERLVELELVDRARLMVVAHLVPVALLVLAVEMLEVAQNLPLMGLTLELH